MPIDKHGNLWAKDVMEKDIMEELDKEGVLTGILARAYGIPVGRRSTGNDVSGHYKRHYFLLFFFFLRRLLF